MATNKYIIRPYPINKPGGVCLWRLVISTIYPNHSETTNKTISGYVSEKAVLDDIERHKKHIGLKRSKNTSPFEPTKTEVLTGLELDVDEDDNEHDDNNNDKEQNENDVNGTINNVNDSTSPIARKNKKSRKRSIFSPIPQLDESFTTCKGFGIPSWEYLFEESLGTISKKMTPGSYISLNLTETMKEIKVYKQLNDESISFHSGGCTNDATLCDMCRIMRENPTNQKWIQRYEQRISAYHKLSSDDIFFDVECKNTRKLPHSIIAKAFIGLQSHYYTDFCAVIYRHNALREEMIIATTKINYQMLAANQ